MIQNIKQTKLVILIVLYKRHYKDSAAITTLLASMPRFQASGITVEFFVWNNTPEYSPCLERADLTWLEGHNDGLPFIYNCVADKVFARGATHLMISDDDTDYSNPSYVVALTSALEFEIKSPPDSFGVMVPKIYSGEMLVSPGERFWFFGRLSSNVHSGLNVSNNRLAINSGVIFKKSCYDRVKPLFDERLNFYVTDTAFFVRYESYYNHFYVLDSTLQHDLSEHTSDSVERAVFRFQEMIKGFRVIFENRNYLFRVVMEAYLLVASVRKSIAHKSSQFFRSYFLSFRVKK